MNPNSMKNLKPGVPGMRSNNPEGHNGRFRPYTESYEITATEPIPEMVRLRLNCQISLQLRQLYNAPAYKDNPKAGFLFPAAIRAQLKKQIEKEQIPKGMLWCQAQSFYLHLAAVQGDVSAATHITESVEGRPTTRVEFVGKNDRLQALVNALNTARRNPPSAPSPDSGANSSDEPDKQS